MNLTLNEKLRFQKQAGIINESQYKKLLKEEEMKEFLGTPIKEGYLNHEKDNYLDGVSGREFEKKEIKDWFKFAPICHILVNDNGNEYTVEFNDVNKALEFVDSLPETAEIML